MKDNVPCSVCNKIMVAGENASARQVKAAGKCYDCAKVTAVEKVAREQNAVQTEEAIVAKQQKAKLTRLQQKYTSAQAALEAAHVKCAEEVKLRVQEEATLALVVGKRDEARGKLAAVNGKLTEDQKKLSEEKLRIDEVQKNFTQVTSRLRKAAKHAEEQSAKKTKR